MSAARPRRILLWSAIAGLVLALAAMNAHLVYVAIASQPDCVAHVVAGRGAAAGSACTPQAGG